MNVELHPYLLRLKRIQRCVRATLAHQRKKNRVDIFMILQRIDYKFNRQELGHKVVGEMRYTFANDILDALANVNVAMDYLHELGYPKMSNKMIDGLVNTASLTIHERQIGYTRMEWSMEKVKMEQVKKYRPSYSLSRKNWDGLIEYLPPIFENINEAHVWLNHNYQYVPRSLDNSE